MSLLHHALKAGQAPRAPAPRAGTTRVAVVAGAGGPLGSAVLEQALARGGFAQVKVLATSPVAPAMRGFQALTLDQLADAQPAPDTGFVVFDRERHANGREAAFLRPDPAGLAALAQRLRAAGVRRLLVVLPHAPALLPQALKHGLATLDEQAVAALDFEQVVFVRSAQALAAAPAGGLGRLARLGRALLAQLHWMVPQHEQPVRPAKLAALVAALARQLPEAPHGTRVLPPELVWLASQQGDPQALVRAWLQGEPMPPLRALKPRM
ncbi:hypothetical protein [Ideonella sp. BN130291]|uniref:hypothetical protein n=1 Tax=Ideonella sp. BN130291 TaxID=3112940 RepID=UPI002E255E8B|nr:hypothetical protein [Ideonella sp. BN130291]